MEVFQGVRWSFSAMDAAEAQGMRQAFMAYLRARGVADADYASAELIFGELVGNVVRHAPGPIAITVDWTGTYPRIIVDDEGPGFTAVRDQALPENLLAEGGRGLFLVDAYSGGGIRVESRPSGGTRVSAELTILRRKVDAGSSQS